MAKGRPIVCTLKDAVKINPEKIKSKYTPSILRLISLDGKMSFSVSFHKGVKY